MSIREPWRPKIDNQPEFNPFGTVIDDHNALSDPPKLRDAEQDTAPLQGSKDLSDADSLEDVIAHAHSQPSPGAGGTGSPPS
ncbi:MAG: hypothetical protein WB646_08725 [Steroidobacteraceae bacterium]